MTIEYGKYDIFEILDRLQDLYIKSSCGDRYADALLSIVSSVVEDIEPSEEEIAAALDHPYSEHTHIPFPPPRSPEVDKVDTPEGIRSRVLRTAEVHVNGERNIDYGDPISDFRTTAEFWETYLQRTMDCRGELEIKPHDVAAMMMMLKVSRISWSPEREDHWIDAAGYAACGYDCVERQ